MHAVIGWKSVLYQWYYRTQNWAKAQSRHLPICAMSDHFADFIQSCLVFSSYTSWML